MVNSGVTLAITPLSLLLPVLSTPSIPFRAQARSYYDRPTASVFPQNSTISEHVQTGLSASVDNSSLSPQLLALGRKVTTFASTGYGLLCALVDHFNRFKPCLVSTLRTLGPKGWGVISALASIGLSRAAGDEKVLGSDVPLWYSSIAFDALVSPLEREESGREVTLAAFFYVRSKTARLCEGLGNSTK